MLITELPKEVVIHLLLDWLDLPCCRVLDTALCCHAQRRVLMQIFADKTFAWNNGTTIEDKNLLYWIWARQIQIQAMVIPSSERKYTLDFDLLLNYLKMKGPGLKYLSQTSYDDTRYGFFEKIPTYLNSSQLTTLLNYCPNLASLDEMCSESVSLVSMGTLRRHCKSLCEFTIRHHQSDSWDPTPLIALVAGGDCGLTRLEVPAGQKYMIKYATILKNLRQLQELRFGRSRDIGMYEPCDKAYIAISEHCKQIQSLHLSNLRNVSDSALVALSHGCEKLQELHVARCKGITPAGIACLVRRCRKVRVLDLNECAVNDEAVVNVALSCPDLRELHMNHAPLVSDAALQALGEHCAELSVIDCSHNSLTTSVGVSALAEGCKKLKHVELSSCFNLSDACVNALAGHCDSLRYVGLMNNEWLTEAAVQQLVGNCPLLCEQGLALNGCMQLTKEFRHALQDRGLYRYS